MQEVIQKLIDLTGSPYDSNPWANVAPPTFEEVRQSIALGKLNLPIPSPIILDDTPNREWHIGRIAYLAVNGWEDPIDIDVGIPSLGCYANDIIMDGWHRFAAAIYRKNKFINAAWSGENAEARKLLFRGKITKNTHAVLSQKD